MTPSVQKTQRPQMADWTHAGDNAARRPTAGATTAVNSSTHLSNPLCTTPSACRCGRSGRSWRCAPRSSPCCWRRIAAPRWKSSAFYVTVLGLGAAVYFAFPWHWIPTAGHGPSVEPMAVPLAKAIFTGTLVADSFTVVLRGLLLLFAVLFVTFTQSRRRLPIKTT